MMKTLIPKNSYFYSTQCEDPELFICAKSYFKDLKETLLSAQKSVFICGWSFNMKTVLDDDGTTMEDVLFSLPESVHVKILIWDYIIFYVADRDPFTELNLALKNKKNIEFSRFDFHPIMSSMHAKAVTVDEEILYMGGIDLDLARRDGERNLPDDETRREADGKKYTPFRDYAFKFRGDCASFMSDYLGRMWSSQKGQESKLEVEKDPKKEDKVFFTRTVPKFKNNPKDFSSFEMHKWLIETARDYIYIENQYLTSERIVDLLIEKLKEPNGPEVIIVVSYGKMPVIEKISMGALLTDCAKRLLENDPYKRLKIYTLKNGEGDAVEYVKIHSKLIITDDKYIKIGSSNINNRSMEFDYELDVAVRTNKVPEYKWRIFSTLLLPEGELKPRESLIEAFEEARLKHGRVVEVKEILQEVSSFAEYKDYLPLDKREMTFFERIGQMLITKKELLNINFKMIGGTLLLLLIITGALFVEPKEAKHVFDRFVSYMGVESEYALMGLFYVSYLILGAFFFPLNAYIFMCGAYFATSEAFILAVAGAISSAIISYGMGAWFKGDPHKKARFEKIDQLKKLLRKNSLKTLVFLRMVPIAPFPLVNVICGKYQVHFGKYVLGTLMGIAPGCFVLIFMEKKIIEAFRAPSFANIAIILGIAGLGALAVNLLKKRMSA